MTEERYVEELWAYDDIMVKDNESGEELWNSMIYERMNEQDEQIKELEIELRNKTVKWEYELGMKLKYHSKLIDSEKENEQFKHKVNGLKSELSIWKKDANEHIKETNKLFEENKDLKDFIRKISTNNEIILANGTIYKIDKVIK